jgi:hypothetical protein
MEIEMVNEQCTPSLVDNLVIPSNGDQLTEVTPERDLLYKTLKIFTALIEDF